jgi:acetyltransferase
VARAAVDPDNITAEFAVVVRSDLKGHGLGALLMDKLLRYCRARGTRQMVGETLPDNQRMLELARRLGFTLAADSRQGTVRLQLALAPAA